MGLPSNLLDLQDLGDIILLGDCLTLLPSLEEGSIDLIVTDPPYGISYYTNYPISKELREESRMIGDEKSNPKWFSEMYRVLKVGSACYVFANFKSFARTSRLMKRAGFTLKTPLIWNKDNWGSGDLKGDFANKVELIVWGTKGRHLLSGRRDHNVLDFKRPPTLRHIRLHPTAKPVDLLEFLISKSSKEGDLVLDPFLGSGSTAVAARNLGRRYIGIEIDKRFYDIAIARLGGN